MSKLVMARLLPIGRTAQVREPGVGIADLKLARTAFNAQRPLIGDVPVLLTHDSGRVVGRVTALTASDGWFVGTLEIDSGADEVVRCGMAVSTGLELERTSRRNEWTNIDDVARARLTEVSLCRRGMVPGAEVISVLGSPKASPSRQRTVARSSSSPYLARPRGRVIRRRYGDAEMIVEDGPTADRYIREALMNGWVQVG